MAGIKISGLGAFAGLGVNQGTLLVMVDPTDTSMAPTGTTKRATGAQVIGNYQGPSVAWPNATAVVLGADPGGPALLRVGGAANIGGAITVAGAASVGGQLTANPGPVLIGPNPPSGAQVLRVDGAANIGGAMTVAGAAALNGGLSVTGNASVTGTLTSGALTTNPGPVVIGPDPGGTQILRIGGPVNSSGNIQISRPGLALMTVTSSDATNYAAINFGLSSSSVGFIGADNGSLITGASLNDLSIRAETGSIRLAVNGGNTMGLQVAPSGAVILGTDPGGTDRLRVGGAIRLSSYIQLVNGQQIQWDGPANAITGAGSTNALIFYAANTIRLWLNATGVGFNGVGPIARPAITGSRAGNAALASLLTQLSAYGLITDSTTA